MATQTIRQASLMLVVAWIFLTPVAVAHHFGPPDREAVYVGASHVNHGLNGPWIPLCESVFGQGDCPTPIPSGVISTSCDRDSWSNLGLFQGIGGVLFCNVPQRSTIGLALHDEVNQNPHARITCLHSVGFHWHIYIATAYPTAVVTLPPGCTQNPNDDPGTTRIGVFMSWPPDGGGGTMGVVTLNVLALP